jgi:hypothetical protein
VSAARPKPPPSAAAKSPEAKQARDFGMAGLLDGAAVEDGGWGTAPEVRTSKMYEKPEEVRTRAPKAPRARRRPHLSRVAFGCNDQRADLYWRQPRPQDIELHRIACTRDACEETTVTVPGVDPLSWWWVGPVGDDQAVAVWRGQDGLLRLRYGAFDRLDQAADRIVMDDQDHGGPETLGVEVFPGRKAVVFWFRSQDGSHAIRVGADGTITSLAAS